MSTDTPFFINDRDCLLLLLRANLQRSRKSTAKVRHFLFFNTQKIVCYVFFLQICGCKRGNLYKVYKVSKVYKVETLRDNRSPLTSKLSTLNSQLSTLNSQPSTLNSKLSTLNSKLQTLISQHSPYEKESICALCAFPLFVGNNPYCHCAAEVVQNEWGGFLQP